MLGRVILCLHGCLILQYIEKNDAFQPGQIILQTGCVVHLLYPFILIIILIGIIDRIPDAGSCWIFIGIKCTSLTNKHGLIFS